MTDTHANGRLAGRLAVITGASRGIGAAVAERFAQEGAHLVLIARTQGGLEEMDDRVQAAGAPPATLVPLDLTDFDALDRLGASLYERHGKLDILVGNAGTLGQLGPLSHVPPDVWQACMDVNVTANYRLIRSLEPLLRQSDAGRAIFVTSGAARSAFPFFGPYAASKAALERVVQIWAQEMRKTPIRANLLDPGVVRTRMRAFAFPEEDPEQHPEPMAVAETFVKLADPACQRHGEIVHAL
ncbi:NAD(P)-dependent dehydrogenase, short-chain alcohol dehydrogenase family [Limimonas halophila]|uniref:NAD(P)-dependent dehydrogenase, short-chain alcohol dehydrogenase family n=1 Tax=Limimonas halophila TaxID=1082479 RepID=A0A1G7MCZ9_9PROT|nr:SDR family NAD(P)-dependent oxidoreductase [Limimonas halophila]SDF59677.1 NAD(P)-dependent dehydrogenase, short-chain alcohol dehydrogenase family [Limimonas halophila]